MLKNIKNILKYTAAYFICFLYLAAAGVDTYAFENGDFQIWNTNAQDVKIGKGTKLTLEEELRYYNNAKELDYQHYDWGIAYSFDKILELAFGYRFVLEKNKAKWRQTDEPYINIVPRFEMWGFKFEDRNRIEYRHMRFADSHMRYRNKSVLKYPIKFRGIIISPYVSDEIFIVSNSRGFNQNRFQPGIELEINKYVKFDVGYLRQSLRGTGNKWTDANAIWLKSKISF